MSMHPRERLEPPAISPLERQLLVNAREQKRPAIQPVPPSSVLSKLKTFLPQMHQANAELQQKLQSCDPTEVDIEHISGSDSQPVIQMDLACGLLELRDDAAVAAAQQAIAAGREVPVETYDGGDSSGSDTDSDISSSSNSSDGDEALAGGCSPDESMEAAAADDDTGISSEQSSGSKATKVSGASQQQQQQQQQQEQQQQQQQQQHCEQQQRRGSRRRKLKANRPMIVELHSN